MLLSLPIITNCSFYLSLFFLHPKPFSIFFLFAQLPPPYAPNLFSLQLVLSFLLHLFCQIVVVSYLFISFFYTMKLCFHCVMGWETQRNHTSIVFFLQNKKIHNESMISLCFSTHNTMKMYFPCIFLGVEKLHNRIMILLFFRGKKNCTMNSWFRCVFFGSKKIIHWNHDFVVYFLGVKKLHNGIMILLCNFFHPKNI